MAAMSWFVQRSRSPRWEARRSNERESLDSCGGKRSQDRVDRDWARNAGAARCGRGDARGASIWVGQHEDKSDRKPFRRETVAAKRNGSRARRLQIIAGLARRRCRVRTASSRLFKEDFEDVAASGVSAGAQ